MDFIKSEIIDLETVLNPVDKYELLEVIGEGTYGQIFLAIDLLSGTGKKSPFLCNTLYVILELILSFF